LLLMSYLMCGGFLLNGIRLMLRLVCMIQRRLERISTSGRFALHLMLVVRRQ
jgi:hypothetical protein